MPDVDVIETLGELESVRDGWDALAVELGRPQMAPAWILAWWRHLAPRGAVPRAVAVRDRGELIGLAPFYVDLEARGRVDYRLPGIEISAGLAPLARPGREWEVAAAIGEALAQARPRPELVALEAFPVDTPWLEALRTGWPEPAHPQVRLYQTYGCPLVTFREDSFDAWLAGKSTNFRSQMRRARRAAAQAGVVSRLATRETLRADIGTFMRLHAARWESLGSSNLVAMGERTNAILADAGEALLDAGRFELRLLELDGEPINAQVFMSAGRGALYVNGGWSEAHAKLKPSIVGLLERIEEGFARGEARMDLGLGEQPYKMRLADGNAPVGWGIVMTPGRRLPLTYLRTAPLLVRYTVRRAAKRRLADEHADRLRRLRAKVRGA